MEAFSSLTLLSGVATENIMLAAAIFTRMSALASFLPGLGERAVPVRVRLTAAMAVTLVISPVLISGFTPPATISQTVAMLVAEAISGALIGFSIRAAVFAIQTAGAIASQSLSLAQLFGSNFGFQPESPIANLLMFAAIVVAVSSGLHFQAVSVLVVFYEIIPVGVFPGGNETGEWAANRAAFAFSAAMSLALPFIVLGFMYNLAIGAANRAMPQLMVAFVGIPAVTLAGMMLLAMTAPMLLGIWLDMVGELMSELMGYAQ
jgi:flagellar biosynthesis protein FliR